MAAAAPGFGLADQHVAVVLDRFGQPQRERGGELDPLVGGERAMGDAVGRMQQEREVLAHEIEVLPADVNVELRFAHAPDRVLRQLPAEHRDDACELGQGAFARSAVEAAADADRPLRLASG